MTTGDVVDTLQDATDSGVFYVAFSANAGVLMDDVSNLQTVDVTPTAAPTPSPKTGTYSKKSSAPLKYDYLPYLIS
jgi:hypothetical protein